MNTVSTCFGADNNHRIAITDYNGLAGVRKFDDPNATQITFGDDVECFTLEKFMQQIEVDQWDLIKMDIEGSEHKVLRHMMMPRAKQISVEFHMHVPGNPQEQIDKTVHHLLELGYEIAIPDHPHITRTIGAALIAQEHNGS